MTLARPVGIERRRAAPFIKANFNPNEPRIPAGEPGSGEWTSEAGTESDSAASPGVGPERPALQVRNVTELPLTPAQATIPWDMPVEIPSDIPGVPTEITPIPFDFPGAERQRPPLPTNPFPGDPECAEEWAHAYRYCREQEQKGNFRPGYAGPGKDFRSCLLGQISERCGGNAV